MLVQGIRFIYNQRDYGLPFIVFPDTKDLSDDKVQVSVENIVSSLISTSYISIIIKT